MQKLMIRGNVIRYLIETLPCYHNSTKFSEVKLEKKKRKKKKTSDFNGVVVKLN